MCIAASPKVASSLFDGGHRQQGQDQPVTHPGQPEQQRDQRGPVQPRAVGRCACRHDQRPRRRPDRSVSRRPGLPGRRSGCRRGRAPPSAPARLVSAGPTHLPPAGASAVCRVRRRSPRRATVCSGRSPGRCGLCGRVAACHPPPPASWPYPTCTGPRGSRTPCTSSSSAGCGDRLAAQHRRVHRLRRARLGPGDVPGAAEPTGHPRSRAGWRRYAAGAASPPCPPSTSTVTIEAGDGVHEARADRSGFVDTRGQGRPAARLGLGAAEHRRTPSRSRRRCG